MFKMHTTFVESIQMLVDISDRLKQILAHYDVSANRFSVKCGIHYNTVRNLINGTSKTISTQTVQQIIATYPDINNEWLQHGIGQMLKTPKPIDYNELLEAKEHEINLLNEMLTLYRINAELKDENDRLKSTNTEIPTNN